MKRNLSAHTGIGWLPSFFQKDLLRVSKTAVGFPTECNDSLSGPQKYFGVSSSNCFFSSEISGSAWNVFCGKNSSGSEGFEKCGTGVATAQGYSSFGDPMVSVVLTKEQRVFRAESGNVPAVNVLFGYGRKVEWMSGTIQNKQGVERFFRLKASDSSVQGIKAEGILENSLIDLPW